MSFYFVKRNSWRNLFVFPKKLLLIFTICFSDSVYHEDYLQVYISAVDNASHFWVQNLGQQAVQLDQLIEDMTTLYPSEPDLANVSRMDGVQLFPIDKRISFLMERETSFKFYSYQLFPWQ